MKKAFCFSRVRSGPAPQTLQEFIRRASTLPQGMLKVAYPTDCFRFRDEAAAYLITRSVTPNPTPLRTLHKRVSLEYQQCSKDSPFNKVYGWISRIPSLEKLYHDFIKYISSDILNGEAFLFESSPMLRFHFPIPLPDQFRINGQMVTHHSDTLFGDPFQQLNIWLPFNNCSGTATLQVIGLSESIELLDNFARSVAYDLFQYRNGRELFFKMLCNDAPLRTKLLKISRPVNLKYGEMLLFDSRMIHATAENTENHTRVSSDFRILSAADHAEWCQFLRVNGMDIGGWGGKTYAKGAYYHHLTSVEL